jgi:hypothetical protein
MDKDTKKLLRQAETHGFVVQRLTNGHYRVSTASGQFVTVVAGTGSDWRGLRNARAALKRAGL